MTCSSPIPLKLLGTPLQGPPGSTVETLKSYNDLKAYNGTAKVIILTDPWVEGVFHNRGRVTGATESLGLTYIDARGQLWEREVVGKLQASWFSTQKDLADGANKALASKTGAIVYAAGDLNGTINVGQFDLLDGGKARASVINGKVVTSGSYSQICNYQIVPPDDNTFAVTTTNPTDVDYYGSIKDVRVFGQNGVDASVIEMLIENLRILGKGSAYGGVGLKINAWDMSLRNFYCEEVKTGITTSKGVQGTDIHIVRAEIAVVLSANGHPTQLSQLYLDGPKKYGVAFFDMSGATINGVQVLRVGRFWPTPGEAAAFFFDSTSRNNKISNVNFTQDDLTTVDSLIQLAATSTNNVFTNFGGTYKLANPHLARMRNQTVVGCTGGWARHNNVTRKCRAQASSVASGASVDLVFTLDWEYPAPSFNFYLFHGRWAARNTNNDAAYGTVHTIIDHGCVGLTSTVTKLAGAAGVSWAITGRALSGNQLTLTVQNTGTATGSISMELERSVDPSAASF